MKLPTLEVGYHYQSVLGQTFNGAHFGISLPLWQQRNTVQSAMAFQDYAQYEAGIYSTKIKSLNRSVFDTYANQTETIAEFEKVLNDINSESILSSLFELGDIDYITYVQELNYFYDARDQYLELLKQQQLSLAELFKYKL